MFRTGIFWFTCWAVLTGLWLVLVGQEGFAEVIAGMLAALLAVAIAKNVRSQGLGRLALRRQWMHLVWWLPGPMLRDCWLVAAVLGRSFLTRQPTRGILRTVPFRTGGDDALSAARRAAVIFAISLTPNTYVVGMDRQAGIILIHQLVGPRHHSDNPVPRWLR